MLGSVLWVLFLGLFRPAVALGIRLLILDASPLARLDGHQVSGFFVASFEHHFFN
jgi:hypothetical protein